MKLSKINSPYLEAIHHLPCCICVAFGEQQLSPTEAHHVFHGRFSQAKTPDEMAVPLCNGHHTGSRDNTKLAIHRSKTAWAEKYGEDHEYTAATQDAVAKLF